MVCSQTGKKYTTKINALARETGLPLQRSDLRCGTSVLFSYNGKEYPACIEKILDKETEGEPLACL